MRILKGVLLEEHQRLKKLGMQYKGRLKKLIRGSISQKARRGKLYGYLAYWENGRVKFKYLGKMSSKKVKKSEMQIKERKKYESLLKRVKRDLKEVGKAIHGRKI